MAKKIGKGKVLLAEPFMRDPNFKRAVVLLCEHNEEGSLGFVLNKPIEDTTIDRLIQDFPEFEADVYFGGPVQTDTIHYVHNIGDLLEDSVEVAEGIYWGGDFEKLKFLISSKLVSPENIRFYIGYTGWSEGQLKNELVYGSWVTADLDANYVFKMGPDDLWNKVMYNKGNPYTVIAQMPDAASWN
jgi:putative transcriptional regulator